MTPEKEYIEKHIKNAKWFKSWEKEQSKEAGLILSRYKFRPEFELYDIEKDSFEFNNLIGDLKYKPVVSNLKRKLVYWMKSQGDLGVVMDRPVNFND